MAGGLPLTARWYEELEGAKDDEMEVNIVHRDRERDDDGDGVARDPLTLTDTELHDKIERLKGLRKTANKLPDKGEKLLASLQKYIDEQVRRKNRQKPICERTNPARTQTYVESENVTNIRMFHSTTPVYQRCMPACCSSAGHHRELEPDGNHNANSTANAFDDDLRLFGRRNKKLMENDQQHSVSRSPNNIRRSPRKSVSCSPRSFPNDEGELTNSSSRSKKQGLTRLSLSMGDENGSSISGRKRTTSSLALQNSSKKHSAFMTESSRQKVVVVLDEEEDKPKQHHRVHRMSLRQRKKDIRIYYPERNHPDSVEISLSDMDCLAPCSYLSSAIMNFYIQYLQQSRSQSDDQKEDYHFFNTFFYSKLEEALDSQVKHENGNSFTKLRRWFKGINIFEKAYMFLPIHACQHWSLAIISIPAREDEAGPIILHLDSLGLHTSGTIFSNIRSYLKAEWEHLNQAEVPAQVPIAEKIWKDLPNKIQDKEIEVPQQENEYDCGLFVLFFMERFIEKAPARLRMTDLERFGRKWFEPAEASCLRESIRALLEKQFKCVEQDTVTENSNPLVLEDVD